MCGAVFLPCTVGLRGDPENVLSVWVAGVQNPAGEVTATGSLATLCAVCPLGMSPAEMVRIHYQGRERTGVGF
jgi:hypothetical protein